MGSRFPSHKLSNGLYVSGRPEQLKERQPTMSSTAMPYTGGDIKKSGELGKMFDGSKSRKSGQLVTGPPGRSGSFGGAASYSGPLPNHPAARPGYQTSGPISSGAANPAMPPSRQKSNSGPLSRNGESLKKTSGPLSGTVTPGVARQNSGPLAPAIPATGLITSGPISSGPLNSAGAPKKVSGPIDSSAKLHSMSMQHNHSITNLSHDYDLSFWSNFPKCALWVVIPLFLIGLIAAVFILVAVKNAVFLIVMVVFLFAITLLIAWNVCWGRRVVTGFVSGFEDAELRTARDGQFVKVSGVVTCGGVPLESSYQRVPRCVYTSTGLYEYRGWDSKAANSTHRRFTWGLRYLERRVVDFYISDFQSGLRALVKAGYGAKVTPYVEENTVIDINNNNKDLSSHFVRWLADRNLSSDDRTMRLKEGYIKEGSTVSVMGVVQRNENVLMIVPPSEPTSTRWQWLKCLLPASVEGIIIKCEDSSKNDAIPV